MRTVFVLSIVIGLCASEVKRYDFYHKYSVTPATVEQAEVLNKMSEDYTNGMIFLRDFSTPGRENGVIVPPQKVEYFTSELVRSSMPFTLASSNFQDSIDEERLVLSRRSANYDWHSYRKLPEIYNWIDALGTKYPKIVEVVSFGKTHEKRDIKGVKISYKSGNPAIFIEGGVHAREWITPATVTYIINELLTSNDTAVRKIAENYDWHIMPVFNPDGYVHSHTRNRMWRKTRKPYGQCVGADLNRNFDSAWNTVGSSNSPCSDIYAGPKAFSEAESSSVSDYLLKLKGKLKIFLSFHSFSQLLMYPYGYTSNPPPNDKDLFKVAESAVKSLAKRYGTRYEFGPSHSTIYEVSGATDDWAYDALNLKFSFIYELRPARFTSGGFELPPEQIIPTSEETLDSVVTLVEEAAKIGL